MEQSKSIPEEIQRWIESEGGTEDYAIYWRNGAEAMYHRMAEEAQSLRKALELAECEIKAMYKRVGINGSNVLDIVSKALEQYSSPVKPTDNGKGV